MTTVLAPAPAKRSAYPRPVEELLPEARELTRELGELPSRNRLMREFRIGVPKADEILDRLRQPADESDPGEPGPVPAPEADATPEPTEADPEPKPQAAPVGHPDTATGPEPVADEPAPAKPMRSWPILLLALPAFVAVWSGWVGLGRLTGFGMVDLLPGIVEPGGWATLDTAITLPIGVEAYAAYALRVWLSGRVPERARRFARWSAIGSLVLGAAGQVAYHLMAAAGVTAAPWQITALVSCLPVAVLGMGAALAHLVRA